MTGQHVVDGDWRLLEGDPDAGYAKWFLQIDEHRFIVKESYYATDALLDANQERLNANLNAKWGDGQTVASIPLNVYFEQLAEAQRQKDHGFVKRWLNDADNARFRTFGGRV